MTAGPDRWDTIQRLFHAALARPMAERAAFLADACVGDEALGREVESLLAQGASANATWTRGAVVAAAGLVSDAGASALTGRRIGVYEVLAPIGAGGMGEVYRARDARLGRDVAVKILPRAFIADPDRLARFEREARVLASFNHPHIGAIHGVEECDGRQALVLEYVEGETLAERIARAGSGGLPINEALDIARQMAHALDGAHEKGIVHRDLKPANVKITPQGVVKVLDFGLAKLDASPAQPSTESPTIDNTREGLIIGTAAYMSPEQARGQAVDKRTDIWAFGCVLYEMLTGRAAFGRATVSDTIAAVLEHEPDWPVLPSSTPAGVRHLLQHTLQKDPRARLRDIADLRFVLADTATVDVGRSRRRLHRLLTGPVPWLLAGALLSAGIVLAITARRQGLDASSGALDTKSLMPLTTDAGLTTEPSISADGRLIAYASNRSGEGSLDIWVQQVTGGAASRIAADPTDDHQPNVSPDGSLVAFRSERNGGGVYVVSPLGGEARLVAAGGMAPRFSPDGRTIAFWTGPWLAPRGIISVRQTFIVAAAGGEPRQMAAGLASAGDPVWSPDGRSLLVYARTATTGTGTDPDWWSVPIDGRAPVKTGVFDRLRAAGIELGTTDTQPYPGQWTAGGVLFAAVVKGTQSSRIWRIAVDQQRGGAAGDPAEVTAGTTVDSGPTASLNGRLVFATTTAHYIVLGLPVDANHGKPIGEQKVLREDIAPIRRSGISDDGRLLVFPLYTFGAGGVWLKDLVTGRERQLVATPPMPLNPVISPSGRWVAYTVSTIDEGGNAGRGAGYVIATTSGTPRKVCDDCEVYQWTADDSGVLLVEGRPVERELTLLNLASGQRAAVLMTPEGITIDRPMLSPTARWVSFSSAEVLRVAAFRPGTNTAAEATSIRTLHGAERGAGWSPDGRMLYVLLETDGFRCLYAVPIDPATGHAVGDPSPVYHFHDASRTWGSTGFGNAVVPGLFLSNHFGYTGNVWMALLKP